LRSLKVFTLCSLRGISFLQAIRQLMDAKTQRQICLANKIALCYCLIPCVPDFDGFKQLAVALKL